MATIYYEKDANLGLLKKRKVAVIGYGSQGHAHAQNLRDSGIKVIVAELPGTNNHKIAVEHGFQPVSAAEATKQADLLIIVLPDEVQGDRGGNVRDVAQARSHGAHNGHGHLRIVHHKFLKIVLGDHEQRSFFQRVYAGYARRVFHQRQFAEELAGVELIQQMLRAELQKLADLHAAREYQVKRIAGFALAREADAVAFVHAGSSTGGAPWVASCTRSEAAAILARRITITSSSAERLTLTPSG